MKAAVYPGNGAAMRIETLPDPEPGPGELRGANRETKVHIAPDVHSVSRR